MKRSALSTALLYAAGGFLVTAGVRLAPPLQADGEAKAFTIATSVSTKTYDAAIVTDAKTGERQLEITSSSDQPAKVEWSLRVMSAGATNPGSRVLQMSKEVSKKSTITDLAARQKVTIPLEIPAAKEKESRQVFVDVDGKSLQIFESAMLELSLTK